MCTRGDCMQYMGQWVRFQTPWGAHRGIVAGVNNQAVLVRVPRAYAPAGLINAEQNSNADDKTKLDLALAQWGYGPGYGRGYGARWGYPGYGGWYGGWWWWWLAFAWIFALAFLW